MASLSFVLRLILTTCLLFRIGAAHPFSLPKRRLENRQARFQGPKGMRHNFPGPYTLYPTPSPYSHSPSHPSVRISTIEFTTTIFEHRTHKTKTHESKTKTHEAKTKAHESKTKNHPAPVSSSSSAVTVDPISASSSIAALTTFQTIPSSSSFRPFSNSSWPSSAAPTLSSGVVTSLPATVQSSSVAISTVTSIGTESAPIASTEISSASPTTVVNSSALPATTVISSPSVETSAISSVAVGATSSNSVTALTIGFSSVSLETTGISSAPALTTIITTVLTTTIPVQTSVATAVPTGAAGTLPISFTNNLGTDDVHVYITGLNSAGEVVMQTVAGVLEVLSTDSSTPVPLANSEYAIPIPDSLTIPDYISSCRIWLAEGYLNFSVVATADGAGVVAPTSVNPDDPSHDVNWGFVELTYTDDGLWADISYVDFVGLPLGLSLTSTTGDTQSAPGVPADGVQQVCDKLKTLAAADGQPWDQLCVNDSDGNLIRVNSPGSLLSSSPDAFDDLFTSYVDSVWETYSSATLTFNTQDGDGDVACTTSSGNLTCAGDNRSYGKPTSADIFGCASGPFSILSTDNAIHTAVVPRLCAAFNRATLLLSGGNVQPSLAPSYYYTTAPNNEYSAVVHEVEVNGLGYAFPYDDVSPSVADDVAGFVAAADPLSMSITVGGG